jgi:aldehyde:ferredoxin oxidoreductase
VPDEGPAKGMVVSEEELQVGLDDYYAARGWTSDGVPTVEKLNELGLGEYAHIVKDMDKPVTKANVKGGKA